MKFYSLNTICAVILILLLTPFADAQEISTNAKVNQTVNYNRLKRIDSLINDYISKNWLKSAVTLVVKDNQLVQYKGYGYADDETKKTVAKRCCFSYYEPDKSNYKCRHHVTV